MASGENIIQKLRENGNEYTWGEVTVKLGEAFGFCWGVERSVRIAYEARKQFPSKNIWLTNQIIHNPTVNEVISLLLHSLSRSLLITYFYQYFFNYVDFN